MSNKRPRLETNGENAMELKGKNDKTVEAMLDGLDAMESCSDPSQLKGLVTSTSSSLLQLKSLQRSVLDKLHEASSALQEERQKVEKQRAALAALEYEASVLEGEIAKKVSTPHLERMCREEIQSTNEDFSLEETMNTFLCGSPDVSYQDVANYQAILAKLHKEINLRGSLERDALQASKNLQIQQKELETSQQFLKELPKKLAGMEKASLPLQKFFHNNSTSTETISTERSKRLEMAKLLPAPLYTLFLQVQSYLDYATDVEGITVNVVSKTFKKSSSKDADWFQPDSHVVELQLTLPDTKNKHVTIEFMYLPKLHVVTALASCSVASDKVDCKSLLINLFPGDTGEMIWSADSVFLKEQAPKSMPGRPYHWCNYLAGRHMPSFDALDPITTRTVMQQLEKRLRANVTLMHLLQNFKHTKTPIPTHESWKSVSPSKPTTRLVGWTEDENDESNKDYVKTFTATLKRKGVKSDAKVTIDTSQYPLVPPKWSLTEGQESWGQSHGSTTALDDSSAPLYDSALGQMERIINTQLQDLVVPEIPESCNWILAHQFHRLVQLWDEHEGALESGSTPGQLPRSIKGKDRVMAEP